MVTIVPLLYAVIGMNLKYILPSKPRATEEPRVLGKVSLR